MCAPAENELALRLPIPPPPYTTIALFFAKTQVRTSIAPLWEVGQGCSGNRILPESSGLVPLGKKFLLQKDLKCPSRK